MVGQWLETVGYVRGLKYQPNSFVFDVVHHNIHRGAVGSRQISLINSDGCYVDIYLTKDPTIIGAFRTFDDVYYCDLVHPDSLEKLGIFICGRKNYS